MDMDNLPLKSFDFLEVAPFLNLIVDGVLLSGLPTQRLLRLEPN